MFGQPHHSARSSPSEQTQADEQIQAGEQTQAGKPGHGKQAIGATMTKRSIQFELLVTAGVMASGLWLYQAGLYGLGLLAAGAMLLGLSLATHLPTWLPAKRQTGAPRPYQLNKLEH